MPAPGIGDPKKLSGCPESPQNGKGGTQMHRKAQNRRRSAKSFNKNARKTHKKNISIMRGGWRL